jgi:hypothetical protein
MTVVGRRMRMAASALVVVLLLGGTVVGQDDDFPFGPFRMYATRQRLDGRTSWYRVEAVTSEGDVVFVPGAAYGLRRAELEGQIPRFVDDPSLLGELATAYAARRPDAAPLVEIHLVKTSQPLAGGRPHGDRTDELVAVWELL